MRADPRARYPQEYPWTKRLLADAGGIPWTSKSVPNRLPATIPF